MKKLLFDFVVQLQNQELPYPLNHNGPLFHKWLPEGETDAIFLNTGEPTAELKVSFTRRGFVDESGFIRFKWDVNKIDPTVIPRQAVLEGGFSALVNADPTLLRISFSPNLFVCGAARESDT